MGDFAAAAEIKKGKNNKTYFQQFGAVMNSLFDLQPCC